VAYVKEIIFFCSLFIHKKRKTEQEGGFPSRFFQKTN
jgi:hypothetical protein